MQKSEFNENNKMINLNYIKIKNWKYENGWYLLIDFIALCLNKKEENANFFKDDGKFSYFIFHIKNKQLIQVIKSNEYFWNICFFSQENKFQYIFRIPQNKNILKKEIERNRIESKIELI